MHNYVKESKNRDAPGNVCVSLLLIGTESESAQETAFYSLHSLY